MEPVHVVRRTLVPINSYDGGLDCKILHWKRELAKKILRAVVAALCAALCAYQIVDRARLFFSNPIGTTVSAPYNSSVMFPKLTVCGNVFGGNQDVLKIDSNASMKQLKKSEPCKEESNREVRVTLDSETTNLTYLWQEADISRDLIVTTVNMVGEDGRRQPIQSEKVATVFGMCSTYSIAKPIVPGDSQSRVEFFMDLKPYVPCVTKQMCEKEDSCLTFLAHNNKWDPQYWPLVTESQQVTHQTDVTFAITIQQFFNLNTPGNPCIHNTDRSKCLYNCCLRNTFRISKLKCRLPFFEVPSIPECMGYYIHLAAEKTYYSLQGISLHTCGCARSCIETLYEVKRIRTKQMLGTNLTLATFYLANLRVMTISEYYMYDVIALMSDAGGILGLYTGMCLLSIFSGVEKIISQVVSIARKKTTI